MHTHAYTCTHALKFTVYYVRNNIMLSQHKMQNKTHQDSHKIIFFVLHDCNNNIMAYIHSDTLPLGFNANTLLTDIYILSNLYGRISRVVKAKYCTSAVGTSVMRCLDNE